MEGNLVFCNDGTLRFHSDHDEKTTLPLISIQQTLENNPFYLLRFFDYHVDIERGTTLRHILYALEPWAELLTNYLDIDIKAYIQEVRRPRIHSTPKYEWIGISRTSSIVRHTKISNEDQEEFEKTNNLNNLLKSQVYITPEFTLDYGFSASGYNSGDNQHHSISCNIHKIIDCQVIIHEKDSIIVGLHPDEKIDLSKTIMGAYKHHNAVFLTGTIDCVLFNEFLHALFVNGIYYQSPSDADDGLEIIEEAVEALKLLSERVEILAKRSKFKVVGEEELPTNEQPKTLELTISSDTLQDILDFHEYEKMEWENLKNKVSQIPSNGKNNIKIGNIKYAIPPEIRINHLTFNSQGELIEVGTPHEIK